MLTHHFIFKPGLWIGEGKLSFNISKEELRFYTKWTISSALDHTIHAFQQVEMESAPEQVRNHFRFSQITDAGFVVELENESMGLVHGTGVIDPNKIGWEFHLEGFEGFEMYSLMPEKEEYALHAEYTPGNHFRTIIHGRIWQKTS
jgi:hypothetical protein